MRLRFEVLGLTALALAIAVGAGCAGGRRDRVPAAPPPAAQEGERAPQPGREGVWHVVQRGQTLWRISKTYGVPLDEIVAANDVRDPAAIEVGQRLFIPGAQSVLEVPLVPSPGPGRGGPWVWPTEGPVTSRFGVPRGSHRHKGIDIDTVKGQLIVATRAGRVVFSGRRGDYGLLVILEHEDGFSSWYAHNHRNLVKGGERVGAGDPVARSGRTGRATGTHLHFEIRHRGKPLDPLTFLP